MLLPATLTGRELHPLLPIAFSDSHFIELTMSDPIVDSKTAESANAAATAHEATMNAFAALLVQSEARIAAKTQLQVKDSIEHAFFVPADPTKQKRFIDITQIPRICDDITGLKNMFLWASRIGAVLLTISIPISGYFATLILKDSNAIAGLQATVKLLTK